MIPTILAGGSGTRLWPLSRSKSPKQFSKLLAGKSLFQETIQRLDRLNCEDLIVITSQSQEHRVEQQLLEIDKQAQIILEPLGRNTAPAISLAAQRAEPDDLLLVLPADHKINEVSNFADAR